MKRVSGLLLLILGVTAQAAQVYTWTDEKGRVHYSDKAVPSAKKIEVSPPGAAQAADAAGTEADKRAQACQSKRDLLDNYQKASRVIERDSLGKEKEFTEEERQQLIARVQQQVNEACAPPAKAAETAPAEKVEPAVRSEAPPKTETR